MARKSQPGIEVRHARACPGLDGGACRCEPTYRAWAWSTREGRKVRRSFPTLAAAKAWRADAIGEVRRGKLRALPSPTLRVAADEFLDGAEQRVILNRSGRPYKPSVLRGYRADLERYVLPELGGARLGDLAPHDFQALADRLVGAGLSASKVRNVLTAVRPLYRRARARGLVAANPLETLELPAVIGRRERVASPVEAGQLLAALPDDLRPLYGTAFYAGLRRGELRGLRWEDVDTAGGRIHVRHGWDDKEGEIEPKSSKGTREVPVPAILRDLLVEWKLSSGRRDGLVFGRTATEPFTTSHVRTRAKSAWTMAKQTPIGLHECRHTFVTLMFEAGVPLERIGDYVGHSSTYMTDRYRHLLDGHAAEAAAMFDAFLERADSAARTAQVKL
jgi:integrase